MQLKKVFRLNIAHDQHMNAFLSLQRASGIISDVQCSTHL